MQADVGKAVSVKASYTDLLGTAESKRSMSTVYVSSTSSLSSYVKVSLPLNPSAAQSNNGAFAVLRADGSVITWGYSLNGGDSSAVATALNGTIDVVQIFSNGLAFAALRADGSVVTWGDSTYGGNSSAVATALNGTIDVVQIFSNTSAFAALRADGSVVTWGDSTRGGDSSAVATAINGTNDVVQISSNTSAFAALRADGSVITWGNSGAGGDSNALAAGLSSNVVLQQKEKNIVLVQPEPLPPVLSSASVDGNTLIIKYTESIGLDTLNTAPNSAFSVSVNGVVDSVLHVSAYSSNEVMLSLTTPVTPGQNVRLSYSDPTNADDAYALQDLFGNDAVSFADAVVTLVGVSA
jgi:uncharacterized repeat protein (TIGR02059 family)